MRIVSRKYSLGSLLIGRRSSSSILSMKFNRILASTESHSKWTRILAKAIYVSMCYLKSLVLHILYMKSSEKALTRNYNAQELELFCHNRFYGPLVVAYNLNK